MRPLQPVEERLSDVPFFTLHRLGLLAGLIRIGPNRGSARARTDLETWLAALRYCPILRHGDDHAAGTVASGTYTFTAGTGPTTTTYRGVEVLNASTLTFESGATITTALFNQNTGTANIYGGNVHEVLGYDQSVTNIYGGSVFYPMAVGSSLGGVPGSGTVNIYGGSITYIATQNTGVMDIFGSGLTETFLGTGGSFTDYSVTGTLQDGTAFKVLYGNNDGTLLFNGLPAVPTQPVPEASTTISFGLLLALGLGGVVIAAKRKKAAVA